MKPVWEWLLGILAAPVVLSVLATPLMMAQFYTFGGYGMMSGRGPAWRMPMHYGYGGSWSPMMGGFGWMGGGLLFSGLIQLGVLILIVLGIIWMVRALVKQNQ